MVRIKLAGWRAIDRRTATARETLAFKRELVAALGGEADLSPQRRKLVDMAARASLLLDHVDAWLFQQRSLVNARAKTLLPVLIQRQALADHLARLLDKLGLDRQSQKVGPTSTVRIYIPDNGRDPHLAVGGATNGQHPEPRPPEPESRPPIARVELPPRDDSRDVICSNEDQAEDGDDSDGLERDLGLR
jgi:hypothetical protein